MFGVVDQSILNEHSRSIRDIPNANIKYVNIHPQDARGACWARALAMTFYNNEDWFLQLDSHMDFEDGWDTYLVNHALELQLQTHKGVISYYPPGFEYTNGVAKLLYHKGATLYNGLVDNTHFRDNSPKLQFIAHHSPGEVVLRGYHVAAGLLFAPGSYVSTFPYDPQLYFIGEEQSLSVRLYTHGWNLFHTPSSKIYHLYNTGQGYRPMHWDASQEQKRKVKWGQLEHHSTERFKDLVFNGKDLGIYGLGKERSLEHFANFTGIDYICREIRGRYELNAHKK